MIANQIAECKFLQPRYFRHNWLFLKLYPHLKYDPTDIAIKFGKNMQYISDWTQLSKLNKIIPEGVNNFKSNTELFNKRYKIAVDNITKEEREISTYEISELKQIGADLSFNVKPELDSFQSKLRGNNKINGIISPEIPWRGFNEDFSNKLQEREKISQIFEQLLDLND